MFVNEPGMQPGMGGSASGSGSGAGGSTSGTYYAPPPGSDQYAENYLDATNAYNRALIRFNQQRTGLLRNYGYAGDIDPNTGMVTNLRVDGGNSYGQLQQLLHNQALEDQNAEYAAEDRGLVGGLAHQAEAELAYGHHGQTSALANSLLGSLSDLDSQQLDAKSAVDQALWQLQHSATTDAIDSGDFNPTDYTGDDTSDGAGPNTPSKKKAISMIGSIPTKTANSLVKKAIAKGQPVSEHGLGQMKSPTKPAAKAPAKPASKAAPSKPNAYTNPKSKKRG